MIPTMETLRVGLVVSSLRECLAAHLHASGRCLWSDPIRVLEASQSNAENLVFPSLLCRAHRRAICRV